MDIVTTSGQGQNSHNIQYLSQGDTLCLSLGRKLKDKVVTISDICHKVVVTISDINCISQSGTLSIRGITLHFLFCPGSATLPLHSPSREKVHHEGDHSNPGGSDDLGGMR